ncbi:helix-turn-helix domain-containing protein [uncultured Tateyamaria sp.]|uniref:winged helix-turn-helix transcriptional regulator n=1 Tax=uncultured Tateyamaria sp. TaxID=455651 RepID=UPI002634469A|nr:helix-turn-helix domain-containing protein [uncultured Tateyamaria sp.]
MSETVTAPVDTPVSGDKTCPAPIVIGMIGGKWKLLILQILIFQGTKRFGELRKSIDGITQTMLTNQLRALEADGLVTRKVYAEVPPRVEYSASMDGLALEPVFTSMHDWWTNRSAAP